MGLYKRFADGSNNLIEFLERLQSGQVIKIKLIGDSITEGVGATNHTVPAGNPIIFDDGAGNVFREGDYTSRCWANYLREFITTNYTGIQFVNAGIGGKSAKWANNNKQFWVSNSEDVVFVMLGTNDRQDGETLAEFEANLLNFLLYVKQRSKLMIVMTANATLNDYDAAGILNPLYNFDINKVDKVISKICHKHNLIHISHYREMLEYVRMSKTPLSLLVQGYAFGSHPMDKGHLIMWEIMQQKLGLIDSVKNWVDLSDKTIVEDASTITNSTPITSPLFATLGRLYYVNIGATHADIANFPSSSSGTLITYRGQANDLYSWQRYIIRGSLVEHMRIWDFANTKWGPWNDISRSHIMITDTTTITTTTPITSSIFTLGKYHVVDIPTSHTDITNFPEGTSGNLVTYRGYLNALYSYQEYTLRNTNKVYRRVWDTTGSVWRTWEVISPSFNKMANTTINSTTPLTSFMSDNISASMIFGGHADILNFPEATAGALLTYRFSESANFSYQTYALYQTNKLYKRYWTGTAWSTWEKISIV